jgi:predicted amidohydrolase
MEEAAAQGVKLLVLPEAALTGYVFGSPEEARAVALEVPGPEIEALAAAAARLDLHVVVGLVERESDLLRNTAVLVGHGGLVGRYCKTHLPFLGVDRFVTPGDEVPVFDTPIGRIGIEICYDLRFPELTRALALGGADIVAHPTNWPLAARSNAEILTRARAQENRIFLLTANRVGLERGGEFCGWSQICDVGGTRLVEAGETEEGLFVAEIDVEEARHKDIVPVPGEYEMYLFGDRRPELYGALVEETTATGREGERWWTS